MWFVRARRDVPNPYCIGLCLHANLNALNLHDDSWQRSGAWPYGNEFQLADALGEQLKAFADQTVPDEVAPAALASAFWPNSQGAAEALLSLMAANSDFTV
ncbi:MAG: hypothetical protein V4696_04495 [Pseudomonadota bacterium]